MKTLQEELFYRNLCSSFSHGKNLIENGKILVNEKIILNRKEKINSEDKIQILEEKIKILYETNHILIVHKPYNMSCSRSFNTPKFETVLNEEIEKTIPLYKNTEKPEEFGLIHRIDKTTEGIVMMAKNKDSYEYYLNKTQEKKLLKKYIGFYEIPDENFVFTEFVQKKCDHDNMCFFYESNYMKFSCFCDLSEYDLYEKSIYYEKKKVVIRDNGVATKTYLKKREKYFECLLFSGKRHQIRVIMSSIKSPIVGDVLYGSKIKNKPIMLFATGIIEKK